VRQGERVGIVWELFGFRPVRAPVAYRLTVERRRPGLLRRAAGALGLLRPARGRLLEWEEDGPGDAGAALRGVELDLTELEPGPWVIRLEVHPRGRTPLIAERTIELRRPAEG
jgi:hypothetical protein